MPVVTRTVRIAPSILSADFGRLGDEVRDAVDGGADLLHLDVMDGHFVPNITFGPPLVKSVRGLTKAVLDCHLMVTTPTKYVGAFCDAGADWVSVHAEAPDDVAAAMRAVRERGRRAGIVVNPDGGVDRLRPFLDLADYVLVMSVWPGFGGQSFIPASLDIVRALRASGWAKDVEIDGGIGPTTAPLAVVAGADVLVAGSAVFGARDRGAAIRALRPRA